MQPMSCDMGREGEAVLAWSCTRPASECWAFDAGMYWSQPLSMSCTPSTR